MSTTTAVRFQLRDPFGAVMASGTLEIENPDMGELHEGLPGGKPVLSGRPMTAGEIEQQAAQLSGTYVQKGTQIPCSLVLEA